MRPLMLVATLLMLLFAAAALPAPPPECYLVEVLACYVQDPLGWVVNCCNDEQLSYQWRWPEPCCDWPPPDACGCTTGHIYGRAQGSVGVPDVSGCSQILYAVRTGWMTWGRKGGKWAASWAYPWFTDEYFLKSPGEPASQYDHLLHLSDPGYQPPPCEYKTFRTSICWDKIGTGVYDRCCTVLTY